MTIAMLTDAERRTLMKSLKLMDLYTNTETIRPYTQATAPASVAVKTPPITPPMMIMGISRAQMESLNAAQTTLPRNFPP